MNFEKSHTDALIASGNKLGKEFQNVAAEAGNLARDYGSSTLQLARDTFTDVQSAASDGARQVRGATFGFARANPWKAMGAAAVAGLVIGLLMSRG